MGTYDPESGKWIDEKGDKHDSDPDYNTKVNERKDEFPDYWRPKEYVEYTNWVGQNSNEPASPPSTTSEIKRNEFKALPVNEKIMMYNEEHEKIVWPIDNGQNNITSHYGYRDMDGDGFKEQFHASIDIGAEVGTQIKSYKDGTVVNVDWADYYGNFVAVQHMDKTISIYNHCNTVTVTVGKYVLAGQSIATVGNTIAPYVLHQYGITRMGYHLDFMIRTDGVKRPAGAGISARNNNPVTVNPIYLP